MENTPVPPGAVTPRLAWRPGLRSGNDGALLEKRQIISSLFIAMLLGIAYQEMLAPVRDEVRQHGLSWSIALLGLSFVFLSMRFFIGNQLHLMSDAVRTARGDVWLFDFVVIVIETALLCFLGGVTAPQLNRGIPITFYHLTITICLVDVGWVLLQWGLGGALKAWRRSFFPFSWAILNLSVAAISWLMLRWAPDPFGSRAIAAFCLLNLVAFAIDMVLIDYHDLV